MERVGATATFTVPASRAGSHLLVLRYANATGSPKTLTLSVNGTRSRVTMPSWADWDTWSEVTSPVTLRAGDNVVSYSYEESDTGHVNLDYVVIEP